MDDALASPEGRGPKAQVNPSLSAKRFNDKYGHDADDFVLSALARAIMKNTRPSDMACRYGGEEFAIVL